MIKELPSPYKERMNDAVVQIYDHAHIAFDIVREFGSETLELENDDLVITITSNAKHYLDETEKGTRQ